MFQSRLGRSLLWVAIVFASMGLAPSVDAATGLRRFAFQGVITSLPDGVYDMDVTITGGKVPFTTTVPGVQVSSGVFSILIDSNRVDTNNASELGQDSFYGAGGAPNVVANVTVKNSGGGVVDQFNGLPMTTVPSAYVAHTALGLAPEVIIPSSQVSGMVSTASSAGTFTGALNGDVTGNQGTTSVDKVKGLAVPASGGATDGDKYLRLNSAGTAFVYDTVSGGGTYTNGTGLTLTGGTTFNVDVGTSGSKIVQLDGSGKIPSAILTASDLAVLNTGKIAASNIDATSIGSSIINSSHIADGTVGSADLALGGVSTQHLAVDSVTSVQLATNSVTDSKIADVGAGKINTGTLANARLPNNIDVNSLTAGSFDVKPGASVSGAINFKEPTNYSGSNTLTLKLADADLPANMVWNLPALAPASNNQLLKFDNTTNSFYWDNDAGAAGGVSGPGTSAANGVARWDGTAGTALKSSNIIISDSDTITGVASITAANVNLSGLSSGRVLTTDGAKDIVAAANVDATELDYLDGVTSNLGSKVNRFTNAEAGYLSGVTSSVGSKLNLFSGAEASYLAGVTSGLQSQIDAAFSAISSSPSATGRIARSGDTMSGTFGLAGANTAPDRVAYLNANRELVTSALVSSAELDFIAGVTSNIGSKLNLFTATEGSRLSGITSNIQAQIDAAFSAISSSPSAASASIGTFTSGGGAVANNDSIKVALEKIDAIANGAQAAATAAGTNANGRLSLSGGDLMGPLTMKNAQELRFEESAGPSYVALKAPALGANISFTLPSNAGTNGQVLQTDGSGGLDWASPPSISAMGGLPVDGSTTMTGKLKLIDGSASNPGFTFASDTGGDTGIYRSAEDELAVTSGGTAKLYVGSAGVAADANVSVKNQQQLRFLEASGNGTNYVSLNAPASLGANVSFTLPSSTGTNGQVLQVDGTGGLGWASPPSIAVMGGVAKAGDTMAGPLDLGTTPLKMRNAVVFSNVPDNTILGANAGFGLSGGVYNVLVGNDAGYSLAGGSNNTLIGRQSGMNTTGVNNTAVGYMSASSLTTGGYNTLVGDAVAPLLTTGGSNVVVGSAAGAAMTTGGNNVVVGNNAGASLTIGTNNVVMGNGANSVATASGNTTIGANAVVTGAASANNTVLGKNATASTGAGGVAIGYNSTMSASSAVAIGQNATSSGMGAIALGAGASATVGSAVQLGRGVNNVPGSLQFLDWNFLDNSGAGKFTNITAGSVLGGVTTGTDKGGPPLLVQSGQGTGAANAGVIEFKTSDTTGTGATAQALTTKMIIKGSKVAIGTTTPSTGHDLTVANAAIATQWVAATDGSTAAPSFQWAGDANTGIYHPAAEAVAIAANGTEVAKFTDGASGGLQLNGGARIQKVLTTSGSDHLGSGSVNMAAVGYEKCTLNTANPVTLTGVDQSGDWFVQVTPVGSWVGSSGTTEVTLSGVITAPNQVSIMLCNGNSASSYAPSATHFFRVTATKIVP